MSWLIYFHFFVAILIKMAFASYTDACYELAGPNGGDVWIGFPDTIPFVPQYIFIEFSAKDRRWVVDRVQPISFIRGKLTNQPCVDSELVFPHMMVNEDEKSSIEIFLYYYDQSGPLIDKFMAYAWKDFDHISVKLEGLKMRSHIKINFSREKRSFTYRGYDTWPYFGVVRNHDKSDEICLTLFKTGSPVVLKVKGSELAQMDFYDHYMVTIIGKDQETKREIEKIYFAKSHVCEGQELSKALIYTEKSVKVVQIQLDGRKRIPLLTTEYKEIGPGFVIDQKSSNVILESVEIKQEDVDKAVKDPDAILLYETYVDRVMCAGKEKHSFVDIIKSKGKHMQKIAGIGDDSMLEHKVLIIRPGTESEIEKCMERHEN